MTQPTRENEEPFSYPEASLSWRPLAEPILVATHILDSARDASSILIAADVLGVGVRLRNEERTLRDDAIEIVWVVDIWSCIFAEEDDEDGTEGASTEED